MKNTLINSDDITLDMDEQEQKILDYLVKAHDTFCELDPKPDIACFGWGVAMNQLQAIIYMRHLKKLYPKDIQL